MLNSETIWHWYSIARHYATDNGFDLQKLGERLPKDQVIELVIAFCGGQRASIIDAKDMALELVCAYGQELTPYLDRRSKEPIYLWDTGDIHQNVHAFISDCRDYIHELCEV